MNAKILFIAVSTGVAALGAVRLGFAQAFVPGYLTDPTAVCDAVGRDERYQPPEAFKYPYVSTYYVRPTVTPDREVKVGFFVTDFDSSRIRFLEDSHRFTAFLEYRPVGGRSRTFVLENLKSGDAEFNLGRSPGVLGT